MTRPVLVYPSGITRRNQSNSSCARRNTSSEILSGRFAAWARIASVLLGGLLAAFTGSAVEGQTLVATVPSGNNPVGAALNQTTNMVYVADGTLQTLQVINGATNTATTIQAGGPFAGVAVNATTNKVYALTKASPASVVVIDGTTNATTATVALTAAASVIAVNPVTNQIYIGGSNSLSVIDGSTNAIAASISVPQGITSLAVDTVKNVIWGLYGASGSDSTLAQINGATNTVAATVQVGQSDTSFALNTTTNKIYVPDVHGNQLYVVDGATVAVTATIAWPTTITGSGLAVNPATNTVYVPGCAGNIFEPCLVYNVGVLNGTTNTVTTSISVPSAGYLLVDSVTNKILLESNPVDFIDGATNTQTPVTGTAGAAGFSDGAVNTATNDFFVPVSNSVLVISAGTGATGPAFSASPSPLAFGNQTQDTTSAARTLTVTNTGTSDLTITTVTAGGNNKSDFIVGTDTCSAATVAAGKTCTVSIEFAPVTTAAESGTLTFADNASNSPQVVSLTGTGVAAVATASTTALSASATSVAVGTSVTLTATVTPASGTPTPTGTVTFKDGASTLGTGTLNGSGVATYSAASLAEGPHTITASYGGDSRNLASASASVSVTVTAASSTTTLTSSAASAVVGSSLTFTATVKGGSGVAAPTGTVTFKDGTATLGTGAVNSSGVATYATSALAAGSHSITASYGGDTNNAASTSSSVAVTVWPGPPDFTMALSPGSGSFKAGTPATVTITLTSVNGFNAATTLACGTLPKNTTCAFSSSSVTPDGSGTATSTLTIKTDSKPASAISQSARSKVPEPAPFHYPVASAGAALAFLLIPLFGARSRRLRRTLLTLSCFGLLAVLISTGIAGCGGGPTTPKGNYPITVTATAGSTTHTATFSLTVQ